MRDYIILKAIQERKDIVIDYKGKTMRVPLDKLKARWGLHDRVFNSKFNNKTYKLYDFRFEADSDKKDKEDNQPTLL